MTQLRLGVGLPYAADPREALSEAGALEKVGVERIIIAEAYSFDAVSQLGFLAATTQTTQLASGILPIYSRTPALLAMTAAGLDTISNGRFVLGLGTSGAQVIEGWHGVPFDAPLGRTREIIDICRTVWRRENLDHEGRYYHAPLREGGRGLGKPLHLINHPVRERIPVNIAALTPKSVQQTAEIAEGWTPIFYFPERAEAAWGQALAAGSAKRGSSLGQLDIVASAPLHFGTGGENVFAEYKKNLALYIGGMGARGANFYNDLAVRYGFAEEAAKIQDLYLAGKKDEAAAAVPDELVWGSSLVGSVDEVTKRIAAYQDAGVTTLVAQPITRDREKRLRMLEQLREILG